MAGRTWVRRLPLVVRTINIGKPDIIGAQEGLSVQLDELVSALPEHYQQFKGRGRNGDSISDDNEFASIIYNVSKLTHIDGGTFWLSQTSGVAASESWGTSLPRCATWSTFRLADTTGGGGQVVVINAHLDHESEPARAQGALLLRLKADWIARTKCGGCPVFLLGDFNAPKAERWWSLLTLRGREEEDGDALRALTVVSLDLARDRPAGISLAASAADVGWPASFLRRTRRFTDAWNAAGTVSCGACGQSTYHGWRGSATANHLWVEHATDSVRVARSGERHVDAILVAHEPAHEMVVWKAKMLTDDKRIKYLGGPHASDHYPILCKFEWYERERSAEL